MLMIKLRSLQRFTFLAALLCSIASALSFHCVICFFSLPVQAAQRANFSAWFVDSLVKVFPDTPATTAKPELILVSARNGHTSLQVALRSASPQIVRMRVIAPRSSNAVLEVRTYRVGTVKVNSHPT